MEILNNPSPDLTPEELEQLAKLKAIIERAIADGKIFPEEIEAIKAQMHSDGKISAQELSLCRELITQKINQGKLIREWD